MIRLILLLLLVGVILAIKYLPWWASLGLAVLFVVSLKFLGKQLLLWLFMMPFRAKGRVLHRAEAEVHAVRRVAAPPQEAARLEGPEAAEAEDGEAAPVVREPLDYYEVDVTITPRPPTGGFTLWEVGELMLEPPGKRWDDTDDDTCEVRQFEIEQDGRFVPDEGFKVPGRQRLRLLLAVRPGPERLVFRYYFERFGEVVLPGGAVITTKST